MDCDDDEQNWLQELIDYNRTVPRQQIDILLQTIVNDKISKHDRAHVS